MPFLLPALSSGICDAAIVYFGWYLSLPSDITSSHDPSIQSELHRTIYQTRYLVPLAVLRLFFLLFPLPYRSYTGTAVRCPLLYQVYYGVSVTAFLIHMLALVMLDPKSLRSLFSTGGWHDSMTRHAWLMLTFSLISSSCHIVLYLHVRSTAPSAVDFWQQHRPKVLFYYAKEREDTERDALLRSNSLTFRHIQNSGNANGHSNGNRIHDSSRLSRQGSMDSASIMNPMHEFMVDLQAKLQKTKIEWAKRMEDYRVSLTESLAYSSNSLDENHGGTGSGNNSIQSSNSHANDIFHRSLTPFRVMLQLFAYEDVLTNGRLNAVYDHDDGAELLFFVPQLLTFLLHGAFDSSPLLEEWILETCKKNVHFAHRCYWFLRAWCLESGSINNSNDFDTQASQNVHLRRRLSRSSSLASLDSEDADDMLAIATTPLTTTHGDSRSNMSKYLPEERAVLAELLLRIMQHGEEPARAMFFGDGKAKSPSTDDDVLQVSMGSPSGKAAAIDSGMIPVNPQTGLPSDAHWNSLAASRRFGFLPLGRPPALPSGIAHRRRGSGGSLTTSHFDETPLFMDALLALADNLYIVPKEQRTDELKRKLKILECQHLPSNSVYIPLQDRNHRVWRIVADESIAIGTKERVPCIITLEVVDHSCEEEHTDGSNHATNNVRGFFDLAARGEVYGGRGLMSEQQIVDEWRFGYRDPHRRDTPFEKLAHTMRDGIRKIPIKQMKKSMKAQIEKFRDTHSNLQELLTVSLPESFDESDGEMASMDGSGPHMDECIGKTDIERGESLDSTDLLTSLRSISPVTEIDPEPATTPKPPSGSPVANTKMGQWSSPHHMPSLNEAVIDLEGRGVDVPHLGLPEHRGSLSKQDRKVAEPTGANGKHSPVTYGSNGLIAWRKRQKMLLEGTIDPPSPQNIVERRPVKRAGKAPPVVFKENWKEKQDRLRPRSAYGTHPGWRLMPILIKANDDLRQEQLASQLIYRMASILAKERVPVWLCPYEILAITDCGGILEAIPDTISIASLKKNDPNFTDLKGFFHSYFDNPDDLADAKANFCESLAAYSIVSFLLQIKDRHNGNILLDNRGHLIHIDFGFFFLSSPGKNTGFESAPFKLNRDFVGVLGGPDSRMFRTFRLLCYRAFIALRRHCMEIILLVEMLKKGNENLPCFRGRPDDAIQGLRDRFRLDLNDRACMEYVNALVDESIENWRTNWYDRYQRYCVGVL